MNIKGIGNVVNGLFINSCQTFVKVHASFVNLIPNSSDSQSLVQ